MTKSVLEETFNQRPARQEKTKLLEVKQSEDEKPKAVEKPEVRKKKEENHEPNKEVGALKHCLYFKG